MNTQAFKDGGDKMQSTTVIEWGIILLIFAIFGLSTFFLKRSRRKYVWVFLVFILVVTISFYSVRPMIVEKQTNVAIQQLDDYLENFYPNDSWKIYETDDYELNSVKTLHVIFDTETALIYEYAIKKDSVDQIGFWHSETGEAPDILIKKGILPAHND